MAFYPASCSAARQASGWTSRIPLLVLTGDKDVWTPLAPCEALLDAAGRAGQPVTLHISPGATHDFDGPGLVTRECPDFRTAPASSPSSPPTAPMPWTACGRFWAGI